MPDTRANKRARLDEDSSPPNSAADITMVDTPVKCDEVEADDEGENRPTRSDEVWYDDGNIVLQAGGEQFRVHKSILSKYSTVFRDMFKVPQPLPTPKDTLDGCPIIKLECDQNYHWSSFLELLYDGRR
jgi:BTB/POZ domain